MTAILVINVIIESIRTYSWSWLTSAPVMSKGQKAVPATAVHGMIAVCGRLASHA